MIHQNSPAEECGARRLLQILEASRTSPPRPTGQPARETDAPARQVCCTTHEGLRPTHVQNSTEDYQNSAEDYQKTQRTIKLTSELITRAWLGYAASGTRPSPTSHNAIRDRHAPQRKLVLPPSQFPTRADLTTTPMTEVEELPPGGDRQSREGDYLSLVTHTS